MIQQGDLFLVDADEPSGSRPGYRRPYVVIQNNLFNDARIATTLICALTTNLRRAEAPGNVLLAQGEANLARPSVVLVSQFLTVDKAALVERIGTLSSKRLQHVLDGVWMVLEPRDAEK